MARLFAIVFLTAVLSYIVVAGRQWALHGTGYWPRGMLGTTLTIVLVVGVPVACVVAFESMKQKKAVYWSLPPLHNAAASSP